MKNQNLSIIREKMDIMLGKGDLVEPFAIKSPTLHQVVERSGAIRELMSSLTEIEKLYEVEISSCNSDIRSLNKRVKKSGGLA